MGTWGLFVLYDFAVLLTVRLFHFAVDPESSWTGSVAHRGRRLVRYTRRRFARPRGRPIELIADDVRHLGRDLRTSPARRDGDLDALRCSYDTALTEACAALDVVHLLDVLEPGTERDLERDRVVQQLSTAGLCLEGTS